MTPIDKELWEMPSAERAERYRMLAARAEHYAAVSKYQDTKDSYARLASEWLRLAEQIEFEIDRPREYQRTNSH